jgi:hypothetical protein
VRAPGLGHDARTPPSGFTPGTMAVESRSGGSGAAAGATWGVEEAVGVFGKRMVRGAVSAQIDCISRG